MKPEKADAEFVLIEVLAKVNYLNKRIEFTSGSNLIPIIIGTHLGGEKERFCPN